MNIAMNTGKKPYKHYLTAIICMVVLIILDQITKLCAIKNLKDQSPYVIIKNVFQLEYLENRGAAFGLFQNQRVFFFASVILITIIVAPLLSIIAFILSF